MKLFLIYQTEVAVCIGAFYVFYKLFLSKDASHQIKRGYIILTSILSHIIPALTFNISLSSTASPNPIAYFSQITEQLTTVVATATQPVNSTSPWQILLWVWGLGLTAMLIRLVVSLYNVNKILNEATVVPNYPFRICGGEILSFSFFNAIVLNTHHFQSPALKYILAHEQTHARQFHTADILLIEMIKTMQWFNPFVWLFAKESALNLEYIADDEVISQYDDAQAYQMAIVRFSQDTSGKLLRTEFSKSNLKNRIEMMNQTVNSKKMNWRYFLVVPVIILLLTSFSLKIENLDLKKELTAMLPLTVGVGEKILEEIPFIKDLPGLQREKSNPVSIAKKELIAVRPSNINNEVQTKRYKGSIELSPKPLDAMPTMLASIGHQDTTRIIRGRIVSKDGKPEPGVNVILKGTSIGTVTNKDGEFALKVGDSYHELLIASPDNRTEVIDISQNKEFMITLTPNVQVNSTLADGENIKFMSLDSGLVIGDNNQPLFINNKEEMPLEEVKLLNPSDIVSLTILKGESAIKLYGEKAKNGVVIIELKRKRRKKG